VPPVDLLLISHNHYDHLDLPTHHAKPGKGRTTAVVPLGLRGYVDGRGFARVHEVDWHDRVEVGGLTVTALPAIHFSKRTLFDRNATLWTGYAIAGGGRRVWFAGDTAYGPVFPQLGRRYAPFDLALVPIGAYEPRELMRASHATPEEAVRLGRDLGARRLVGMHWGTIQLTDEPPFEPPERFTRIRERLADLRRKVTLDDMAGLQTDTYSAWGLATRDALLPLAGGLAGVAPKPRSIERQTDCPSLSRSSAPVRWSVRGRTTCRTCATRSFGKDGA
jgi:L-ascorbate metabolism protein UlaG (beta-lactamase superfamily)